MLFLPLFSNKSCLWTKDDVICFVSSLHEVIFGNIWKIRKISEFSSKNLTFSPFSRYFWSLFADQMYISCLNVVYYV